MDISEEWVERFNQKWLLDEVTQCWMWQAAKYSKGYGQIKIPGTRKQIMAHRLSYMIHKGPVPDGKFVLHRCDTPACVNPEHLFVGTKRDNSADMVSKMRHCYGERQGAHKLTERDVLSILGLIAMGMKQSHIARQFNIGQMQISRIKKGHRWAHLTELFNRK